MAGCAASSESFLLELLFESWEHGLVNPEIESILEEPDAELLRVGPLVQARLVCHTVAMFFFNGAIDYRCLSGNGSGVFVKVLERRFVFTAGHCVHSAAGSTTA
jgi:hypothetical protein